MYPMLVRFSHDGQIGLSIAGPGHDAEETLSGGSVAPSAKDEALAAVVRALKEDGLL
jgi:hypothetical protein